MIEIVQFEIAGLTAACLLRTLFVSAGLLYSAARCLTGCRESHHAPVTTGEGAAAALKRLVALSSGRALRENSLAASVTRTPGPRCLKSNRGVWLATSAC